MLKFDYRQFQCPHPIVETRKQLLANPGQPLVILVGDRMASENIERLAGVQGYAFEARELEGGYALTLTPQAGTAAAESTAAISGKTVIFCNSDQLGSGDEELGRILLKNFFITLTEVTSPPELILFVNSGVKLTCGGSEILEALDTLACMGVDIASCGLCLDFYKLKDQLQAGRVTNMLEIAEAQLQAGRVIKP